MPYEVHEAGIAEFIIIRLEKEEKRLGRSQLTANEPETIEYTGKNSTVFWVSDLSDVTGSCSCRHGDSETENETPTLELCHVVGWRLDTCTDNDEQSWELLKLDIYSRGVLVDF